jgi:hypothetical protein|uniref:Uncharacterized protein n=1 Tax=viral metagenome TaxID=1070528 RepID=A0A6C0J7L0_9ZZZZ|tara:strand:+ start:1993 stop:2355 length:363 start_codon:yes stop_codon:yes gene_type:complete
MANRKANNLIYDKCFLDAKVKEYNDSLNYALYDGKYYNSSKCRMELGLVGGNNVSLYSGNLVDLESNLLGIQNTATKYATEQNMLNVNLVPQDSCQMIDYSQTVVPAGRYLNYCGFTKPN